MRLLATLSIVGLLSACPSAPVPTKVEPGDAKSSNAGKPDGVEKPPAAKEIVFEPPTEPAPAEGGSELGGSSSELATSGSELATPAWFDTGKIDHAKILQAKNQAKVGASTATAMLLEMKPGTTPEDCIAAVRTEMAKTVGDVVEPVPGENGRMTLQGKSADYSYTVVCGPGKAGQTTLYLSYVGL